MIHIIEIDKPFRDNYGAKIPFTLPQEVEEIKSILIRTESVGEITSNLFLLPTIPDFDLIVCSLLLNNGNDQILSDAVGQVSFFDNNRGYWDSSHLFDYELYKSGKVILNKKIIKNSVHYAVFKMQQRLIDYIDSPVPINTGAFGKYIRETLKLILYIEAA